jgi:hypothetical protein
MIIAEEKQFEKGYLPKLMKKGLKVPFYRTSALFFLRGERPAVIPVIDHLMAHPAVDEDLFPVDEGGLRGAEEKG